jgi:hypothetical protein
MSKFKGRSYGFMLSLLLLFYVFVILLITACVSRGVEQTFPAVHTIYDPKYQHYLIQWAELQEFTEAPSTITDFLIGIEWNGVLSDDMRGIYRSKYHQGDREVVLVSTQFESTDARAMFPCFDEPAMKAKFVITVTADKSRGMQSLMFIF